MDEFKKYLFEHRDELDVEKAPRLRVWQHIEAQTGSAPHATKTRVITIVKWLAAVVVGAAIVLLLRLQTTDKNRQVVTNEDTAGHHSTTAESIVVLPKTDSSLQDVKLQQPNEQVAVVSVTPGVPAVKKNTHKRKFTNDSTATHAVASVTTKAASPFQDMEDSYATMINYQLQKVENIPIYGEDANYFHTFKKQWYDLNKDEQKVKRDLAHYGLNEVIVERLLQLYQQKLSLLKTLQSEIHKINIRARQYPPSEMNNPTYFKL